MRKNFSDAILWYSIQYQGDWNRIAQALKDNGPYQKISVDTKYVTICDKEYPDVFRQLRYPPWILFFHGDLSLCKMNCIGIVGSRNCSQNAILNTKIVTNHLKNRYCIVSGLAKGVDSFAHRESLDKHTIGIIGCGINRIYPYQNKELFEIMKKDHLILSEYPGQVAPMARNFPWRNRLIAALSSSLIVIEASMRSGTMLTVNESLELSRPVYCLPSTFNDKNFAGCNYLISQGANILYDESDLEYI